MYVSGDGSTATRHRAQNNTTPHPTPSKSKASEPPNIQRCDTSRPAQDRGCARRGSWGDPAFSHVGEHRTAKANKPSNVQAKPVASPPRLDSRVRVDNAPTDVRYTRRTRGSDDAFPRPLWPGMGAPVTGARHPSSPRGWRDHEFVGGRQHPPSDQQASTSSCSDRELGREKSKKSCSSTRAVYLDDGAALPHPTSSGPMRG